MSLRASSRHHVGMEMEESKTCDMYRYDMSVHYLMAWQGCLITHYTTRSFKIISFCGIAYLGAVDTHMFGIRRHYHVESIVYPGNLKALNESQ